MTTRMVRALLLASVAATCVPLLAQADDGNPNPGILPPNAEYRGFTYGEWAAMWWQAAFNTPVRDLDHPFFSGQPFQGPKGVVFLAGAFADPEEPAVIEITIPAGTPLFFPVINVECSVFESGVCPAPRNASRARPVLPTRTSPYFSCVKRSSPHEPVPF